MIDRPLALVLILVVAVVAATACGASGRLDGGPGPLPDRAGALSNKQGNQDFSNESYEDALEAYQRAGRELPDRPEPHYNAGNTWYRQQNFEDLQGFAAGICLVHCSFNLRGRIPCNPLENNH